MIYTVGMKRAYFLLSDKEIMIAIRTSGICQKINEHKRQAHYPGSIEDPQLSTSYQSAVLGLETFHS